MTTEEYHMYCDEFAGYCPECDDMTRECDTEPDATEYECPVCEKNTCMGVEEALMLGHLQVNEE